MGTPVQNIAVIDYSGPQGTRELSTVESSTLNRTKTKARVKTMNRTRRPIAFQTGTEEVEVTLTVVPELLNPEVNWVQAWKNDEVFRLTVEKGISGVRESVFDCEVQDVNDTHNEAGEARQEVTVMGLRTIEQPA